MRCARIVLGYDGTEFFGSQTQSGVRTVQSDLQRAIERVAPGSGSCVLAGRTDRGVHAIGQVASADVRWSRRASELRSSLDAVSPVDLVIKDVDWAAPSFHARFDARWREYRYRIVVCDEPPVLDARYVWWRRRAIDDSLANRAARQFAGEHSFGAFAGRGWSRTHAPEALVRVVKRCDWQRVDLWENGSHRVEHVLRIVANGFLPQMVRNIVSAVVSVGTGERSSEWIADLLEAGDRGRLGDAAPPHGLTLWRVSYDEQDELKADERLNGECEVY